jgi:hypothetical protein
MNDSSERPNKEERCKREMELILEALQGIKYGEVRVTINDGVVVQIDRMVRTRIPAPSPNPKP